MTFKNILVHVPAEPSSAQAVEVALALAQRFDARLIGVGAETYDVGLLASSPYADGGLVQALRDQVETDLTAAGTRFRTLAAPLGAKVAWMSEFDFPGNVLPVFGRCADLVVALRPGPLQSSLTAMRPADLVLQAGLPVLLAPEGAAPLQARTVVIGWKDTRESRRALSDALPFLIEAKKVVVVGVSGAGEAGVAKAGLAQVAERLTYHGVVAETLEAARGHDTVAEVLERTAERLDADLIVVGAYGRSRLREWAFGGVTEELMTASSKYVLFSR